MAGAEPGLITYGPRGRICRAGAEYGSTQQVSSHLKQQMGAGDQPGKRREGHRATGTSEWERGQGQRNPSNSACELAGVTWQAIPTCSQTINSRNRAIAVPQRPWGGHSRGSVVTEVSRCHGYTKAAAVGRCVSVSREKKEQLWPVPGTGFCQPGCCYRGGEGH